MPSTGDPVRQEVHKQAHRLMAAAIRAAELDHADPDDLAEIVAEPARPEHWEKIEEAFQGFRVPFDPDLKYLYEITLGVQNPHSYEVALCPPFLGAFIRAASWEIDDLDGLMDNLHFWPLENILDEFHEGDAFPFLVVACGFSSDLTIGPNGKWSVLNYHGDGGPEPERSDFTLDLRDALRIFVECAIEGWAYDIAKIPYSERPRPNSDGSTAQRPASVQAVYLDLTKERDLSDLSRAAVSMHPPSYLSAAAAGVMPFDENYTSPE